MPSGVGAGVAGPNADGPPGPAGRPRRRAGPRRIGIGGAPTPGAGGGGGSAPGGPGGGAADALLRCGRRRQAGMGPRAAVSCGGPGDPRPAGRTGMPGAPGDPCPEGRPEAHARRAHPWRHPGIIGGGGGWIGSAVFLTKRRSDDGVRRLGVGRRQHHLGVGVQDIESARGILFRGVRGGGVVLAALGPRDRDIAAVNLDDVAAPGCASSFRHARRRTGPVPTTRYRCPRWTWFRALAALWSSGRSASGDTGATPGGRSSPAP